MTKIYFNGFASLANDASLEQFVPYVEPRRLRRMEAMAKNTLLCSFRALEQAQMPLTSLKTMGLSVAVGAGSLENTCKFMDSILQDGDELSSPTAFAGSVHNSTALSLSIFLNINGPCVTTGQFEASFPAALLSACSFLHQGACEDVLIAVAEDVNGVAASYAPNHVELFQQLLRTARGPFERAAAAMVLSTNPQPGSFELTRFEFNRTEDGSKSVSNQAAFTAMETVRLLQTGKSFILTDDFAGTQFKLEATPYVKP